MNRKISPRVPTLYAAGSYAAHWRSNQRMPLLTVANETCRDILFLIAPEYRTIMFEDGSQARVAGQALVIQSENDAGHSVCADESHVTVNRKEHGWTAVIGRHSRDYPHMPETMAKQPLFHVACCNLCRRKHQRMGLT